MSNQPDRTVTVEIEERILTDILAICVTWHQMDMGLERHNPPAGALDRVEEWAFLVQVHVLGHKNPDLTSWRDLATYLHDNKVVIND